VAALSAAGFDAETEARRIGLPEVADPRFEWRVAIELVEALFERGVALCGPDFPLAARTSRPEENRSPINLLCRTRRTVREAVRTWVDHHDLVTDGYALRLAEDPGGVWVEWRGPPRPTLWWFDAADSLTSLRSVISSPPWFAAIRTPFAAPPGASALFACPIEPGPTFAIRFPARVLDVALTPVDAAVRAHVERIVAGLRPADRSAPGIVAALWALGPTATAARLADLEGISERTLHRRLAQAGTSFRAELDAIRRQFAGSAQDRSAEELAVLLGYSDVRAYRRAARRWGA
jgi:AraC-like DNA-binding protein